MLPLTRTAPALAALALSWTLLAAPGCAVGPTFTDARYGPRIGPDAPKGDCSVSGVARVEDMDGNHYTAAGRQVDLFPVTPGSTKWMRTLARYRASDAAGKYFAEPLVGEGVLGAEPKDVIRQGRSVYGYGPGRFEFTGVAPGDYYVLFRYGTEDVSFAKISVAPGQHLKDVQVTYTPPGAKRKTWSTEPPGSGS